MKRIRFNLAGIQGRILFLAIVPATLVMFIVGYYVTVSRINDTNAALEERGNILTRSLASASEFGLFVGNFQQLNNLAQSSLQDKDVQAVLIYGPERELLVTAVVDGFDVEDDIRESDLMGFTEAVEETGINVQDFENPLGSVDKQNVLGWVSVILSKKTTHERQTEILITSFLIVVSGLFMSILIALQIGRSVVSPVRRLNHMVQNIREGNLNARVKEDSVGELGMLETGFNAMAGSLNDSHKQLNEKIQYATRSLTQTVSELEKKNTELEVARGQALEASRAKTDFLAKMSHEIGTPVNALIGFSRLLERSATTAEQKEYSRTIQQAAAQLHTIINDILNFSRLELGKIHLEHIAFELRHCLEDVMSMFRLEISNKDLELALLIDPNVPTHLFGDPTRLAQAVSNLVSNAIKFTQQGAVVVSVHVLTHQGSNITLRFEVHDSGIGLNKEDISRLFKAFSQADSSITRRFGGTGLGLSIVKRLVALMGGEINVTSQPGEGSTFWFTGTFEKNMAKIAHLPTSLPFEDLTVLVCEPHHLVRQSLVNSFKSFHMNVIAEAEFEHAWNVLKEHQHHGEPIALLTISIGQKEISSAGYLQRLSLVQEIYGGPIIIFCNSEQCSLLEEKIVTNRVAVISKPFRLDNVKRAVEMLFGMPLDALSSDDSCNIGQSLSKTAYANINVLVADDNEFNLLLVKTLLSQKGIVVTEARNGLQAIEQAYTQKFDLILMDLHMPELDGLEATKQIREQEQEVGRTPVPIVALTADVVKSKKSVLEEYGFTDFMIKPLDENKLWSFINRWTNPDQASDTNQSDNDDNTAEPVQSASVPDLLKDKLILELEHQAQTIRQLTQAKNKKALSEQAHQLKGIAGYFALSQLVNLVEHLEELCSSDDWLVIEPASQQVIDLCEQIINESQLETSPA
ncbi:MAG: ATP-binding protein [Gammaproteobacteria bacterium]|nr:ATP-binding protein [Gammaproteobacteria bacterium]